MQRTWKPESLPGKELLLVRLQRGLPQPGMPESALADPQARVPPERQLTDCACRVSRQWSALSLCTASTHPPCMSPRCNPVQPCMHPLNESPLLCSM